MSFAARLSAFFLGALAVVLVGFSTALYLLATVHLHRQVDERLNSALTTLAAAAEVSPNEVEWEPDERALGLGVDSGPEQVRWVIRDDRGQIVDRSANLNARRLSAELPEAMTSGRLLGRDGRPWSVKSHRLIASSGAKGKAAQPASGKHSGLILVAFAPLGPTETTLRTLAWTLTLLSVSVLAVAAIAGRRVCRRALAPLSLMAIAARSATAADPETRMPVADTGDELEELAHAINGLLDRLHEALERQRRFSGEASHQLRTPLAALQSQVDVALRRDRDPEEYRRVLTLVKTRSTHLRQIIESLLFLARAETEADCPEMEVIELGGWIREHRDAWSGHARAADLTFEDDAAGPIAVRAHPPLLSQLVDSLIENALKYSEPGTPVVVRTSREPGGPAVLTVTDRGTGIAHDEIPHVFTPFYRSPQARRQGRSGAGLGLAIAGRIVASFDGAITVDSEVGSGSRFAVRFPSVGLVAADRDEQRSGDLVEEHR